MTDTRIPETKQKEKGKNEKSKLKKLPKRPVYKKKNTVKDEYFILRIRIFFKIRTSNFRLRLGCS